MIDVGCGKSKHAGYIGIDIYPFPGVDIVRDATRGLPFEDNSVNRILSRHFMEHFSGDDLMFLVDEFWRVSEPNGSWLIIVPDITSPNRYRDPTHKTFYWSEDSWIFWELNEQGDYLIDRGPMYGTKAKLKMVHTELYANGDRLFQVRPIKVND